MSSRSDPGTAAVRDAAGSASTLPLLADLVGACRACPELADARSQVVPGDFPPGARVLLVGEAPGAAEDETGRPFVGRAGRLLDELLVEARLDRRTVAVTNVCRCRPPGNRTPSRAEARRCAGWLDRQVELAGPQVVVTMGGTAAAWAFGPGQRLADLRGCERLAHGRTIVATYHPSAALRFGPNGAPMAALRVDLALAARLAEMRRPCR